MLHIRKIALLLPLLLLSMSLFAGPGTGGGGGIGTPTSPAPNCAVNPAAGNTCETATPICDLNGYCGSTSSSYTANYWPQLNSAFCGSIENNSFLIFTASATSMTFNVWLTSSSTGDGIQIMVFSSTGYCSGAITSYVCWSPGTGTAGPTAVTATGLTPGNNYYIMIDGFAGDVSNYIIGIASGAVLPVNVASSLSGGQTICLGQSATLTAGGGNGTYTWDNSPGMSAQTGSTVTVTPTSEGTFEYIVHSASGSTLCPSTNQASTTVQVVNCTCSITASNSGDICPGGTADLSATNVAGATAYNWTGPNGFTSSNQSVATISPPTTPGSYDYIVTATVPAGTCASTTTIEVLAPPNADVPNDTTVCNSSVIPAATFTSTPTGATYTWTNSNPAIGLAASGSGNTPSFTAVNSGTTPLTATITVTPTIGSCVGQTSTYTITVNPVPAMNAVSDITQCHAVQVNEVVFGSSGSGTTYAWTNSNTSIGLLASGSGNISAFTPANTGTLAETAQIAVTPSVGTCVGTVVNFTITINPLPIVEAGTPQTVCAGTSIILAGSGAVTYAWDNSITDNTAFPANNTQTYTVTGTDANGCISTDNVTITVFPYPTLDAGLDQAICIGEAVTLTGSGSANITWNNGVVDGVTFIPTATQTYTLTATDANNCQSTDEVIVTVNPLPIINAGADKNICVGTPIILAGTGGVSYQWTNNVTDGQAFQPAVGTITYTVTGTDINGCISTDAVTVTVLPVSVASFEVDQFEGYPVLNVNFINTSTGSNSYLWNFGDGVITPSSQMGVAHTYPNIGNYEVILITSNGICSDTASLEIIVFPYPTPEIIVPNVFTPNNDKVNDVFWIDVKYAKSIEVRIYNRWGNLMLEMNETTDRWDGTVNGNEASDGVYFHKYVVVGLNGQTIEGHGNITLER